MVLFDTKTNQIIEDAVEHQEANSKVSIWINGKTGNPIAYSCELEYFGYKVLSENAPEVIKARNAIRGEVEDIFIGGEMPEWFSEYTKKLKVKKKKQENIRQTYCYKKEDWIDYFDSSFPSTFLAGYKIVSNLLKNKVVKEKYAENTTIKILDIGCGSGGATIGTITAINQFLPHIEKIELYAYDFNNNALDVFDDCLRASPCNKSKFLAKQEMKFVPENSDEAKNMYTFDDFDKKVLNENLYDFILCFKMVNELISPLNNQGFKENPYSKIIKITTKHISKRGFFILLDVSWSNEKDNEGKTIDPTKYAIMLNEAVIGFLKSNKDYRCIIPIPCAIVSNCKSNLCWIQRLVKPEGGREFPATYKVLTQKEFGNSIIEKIEKKDTSKYIVQERKKDEEKKEVFRRCFYQNGIMTKSEDIKEEDIKNYENGFCL